MKYEVFAYSDPDGKPLEISQERFEEIVKAKKTCLFALELEEKFALLFDNYFEFETELLILAEKARVWEKREHGDAMLRRLAIDRRLVNLLTSCRLYQDQTEHGISKLFGNPSDELNSVKNFRSELYDNHFGYRFFEAVRNHVQHNRLPVQSIGHRAQRIDSLDDARIQITVIPQLQINSLKEDIYFKKSVLEEIDGKSDVIDLRSPAREYVDCFRKLHLHLRETLKDRLEAERGVFQNAITEFSTINGKAVKYPSLHKKGKNGTTLEKVALMGEFLDYFDTYEKRNFVSSNLTQSCAANSDLRY